MNFRMMHVSAIPLRSYHPLLPVPGIEHQAMSGIEACWHLLVASPQSKQVCAKVVRLPLKALEDFDKAVSCALIRDVLCPHRPKSLQMSAGCALHCSKGPGPRCRFCSEATEVFARGDRPLLYLNLSGPRCPGRCADLESSCRKMAAEGGGREYAKGAVLTLLEAFTASTSTLHGTDGSNSSRHLS